MRFWRGCLAGFCFLVFGIGSLVLSFGIFPVLSFVRHPERRKQQAVWWIQKSWRFFAALMIGLHLIEVKKEHFDRLAAQKGSLIIANHPSLIDVVLMFAYTPRPVCLVKGKLLENFFIKRLVQTAFLTNDMEPDAFLEQTKSLLLSGHNLIIFPEGTRTLPHTPVSLHRGIGHLAYLTKAPVLPVRIVCSPPILGKHQKWYDVADKRVLYTLTCLPVIHGAALIDETKSQHINAKRLTNLFKERLFP